MPSLLFHSGFYSAPYLLTYLLVTILLIAAVYDVKTFTIPHIFPYLVIFLFIIKTIWVGVNLTFLPWHLLSVFIAFILGFLLFVLKMMGGGDVKLFAALAVWFFPLGLLGLVFCIALTGIAISVGIVTYKISPFSTNHEKSDTITEHLHHVRKMRIPYGPAIAIGTVLYLIFSNNFSPL